MGARRTSVSEQVSLSFLFQVMSVSAWLKVRNVTRFCMTDPSDSASPAFPGVAAVLESCVPMVSLALSAVSSVNFHAHTEKGRSAGSASSFSSHSWA